MLSQASFAGDELSNNDIRSGKLFPFKSAKVVYQKSGMTTGTETLWIDDYGRMQVRESNMTTKVMNITQTQETIAIVTPETITTINLKEKTAVKMANPAKNFYESLKKKSDAELEQFKKSMMNMGQQMTGQEVKPIGKEKLLGKECDVYEMSMMGGTTKLWTWKNLNLKTETQMMGNKISDVATSLEVGVKIPKEKTQIPAGIQLREMPAMGNMPFALQQKRQ